MLGNSLKCRNTWKAGWFSYSVARTCSFRNIDIFPLDSLLAVISVSQTLLWGASKMYLKFHCKYICLLIGSELRTALLIANVLTLSL